MLDLCYRILVIIIGILLLLLLVLVIIIFVTSIQDPKVRLFSCSAYKTRKSGIHIIQILYPRSRLVRLRKDMQLLSHIIMPSTKWRKVKGEFIIWIRGQKQTIPRTSHKNKSVRQKTRKILLSCYH